MCVARLSEAGWGRGGGGGGCNSTVCSVINSELNHLALDRVK